MMARLVKKAKDEVTHEDEKHLYFILYPTSVRTHLVMSVFAGRTESAQGAGRLSMQPFNRKLA